MFPSSYFPPRYFAPRYWERSTGFVPPPPVDTSSVGVLSEPSSIYDLYEMMDEDWRRKWWDILLIILLDER